MLAAARRFALALAPNLLLPAQDVVPAGSINGAFNKHGATFVVEAEPAIAKYAETVRKQFFAESTSMTDAEAASAKLDGRDLMVYGTPASAWLAANAARLPFRFRDGAVEIDGREFKGDRLRVICAIRNPADPSRKAVVYAAARAADVVGINGVFHGPTEWVVADGDHPLASGAFAGAALTAEQQRADLEFLRATIADVHPATTKGIPDDLAAALAKAEAALTDPRPRAELWKVLQPVLLALHDGHSSLSPPGTGESLALPLAWLGEGLVVTEDQGPLRRGDRILSLGGQDEPALLARLSAVVAAENVHWVKAHGERMLADLGVLRALGVAAAAPVRAVIDRNGAAMVVDVPLGSSAGRRRAEPWVRFAIDKEHDLAVFTLDTCVDDDTYRTKLDEFFVAVHEQRIGRIAVDLRRNGGGGSTVVDEFLRYLDVDAFTSLGGDVRVSQAVRDQRGAGATLLRGNGKPVRRRNARHPEPPPFAGKVFVLTGKHTFSSANWFAVVLQDNKIGEVVGEPTGNAPSSYGDILSFTLPQSGLSFTLSFKRWHRPDPARDPADCVAPDVVVPTTRKDVLEGTDPVLEHLRRAR